MDQPYGDQEAPDQLDGTYAADSGELPHKNQRRPSDQPTETNAVDPRQIMTVLPEHTLSTSQFPPYHLAETEFRARSDSNAETERAEHAQSPMNPHSHSGVQVSQVPGRGQFIPQSGGQMHPQFHPLQQFQEPQPGELQMLQHSVQQFANRLQYLDQHIHGFWDVQRARNSHLERDIQDHHNVIQWLRSQLAEQNQQPRNGIASTSDPNPTHSDHGPQSSPLAPRQSEDQGSYNTGRQQPSNHAQRGGNPPAQSLWHLLQPQPQGPEAPGVSSRTNTTALACKLHLTIEDQRREH